MKKTQEIIGLPIISICDGIEVGIVKNIIVNAEKGAIDFIVVDSGIQMLGARLIQCDNVLGIGDHALTIENNSAINDISKVPVAIDLLQKNIEIKGSKVLTKFGKMIGEIGDFYVDEQNRCKISGLEFITDITQRKAKIIPRKSIITYGKNLTIVEDNCESTLIDSIENLNTNNTPIKFEKSQEILHTEIPTLTKVENYYDETGLTNINNDNTTQESIDTITFDDNISPKEDTSLREAILNKICAYNPEQHGETTVASLFEEKQKIYLKGRKLSKAIDDNIGNILFDKGTIIDDDVFTVAKQNGKMIQLLLNNE